MTSDHLPHNDFWESCNFSQIPEQASRVRALQSILRKKLGPFGENT
ncbi:MAG: hypothetical protein P8X58_14800 [Syntrophobacterales bacterium]|jgi:hypothetical protein